MGYLAKHCATTEAHYLATFGCGSFMAHLDYFEVKKSKLLFFLQKRNQFELELPGLRTPSLSHSAPCWNWHANSTSDNIAVLHSNENNIFVLHEISVCWNRITTRLCRSGREAVQGNEKPTCGLEEDFLVLTLPRGIPSWSGAGTKRVRLPSLDHCTHPSVWL